MQFLDLSFENTVTPFGNMLQKQHLNQFNMDYQQKSANLHPVPLTV